LIVSHRKVLSKARDISNILSPLFPIYNDKHIRLATCVTFISLSLTSLAQSSAPANDFAITLERRSCLGNCPDYEVTILANGSVRYEGRWYVRVKGIRQTVIPVSTVQELAQEVRDKNFFQWQEKKFICIDYPEVHITAISEGRRKHVLEGCNTPGKVLKLADEIDRISGAYAWVGHSKQP